MPFSPTDIAGLDIWLTAGPSYCFKDAAATLPCADGDAVYTWVNRRSGGANAVQSSAGSRPLLKLVSGRWVVRFDGSDDVMDLTFAAVTGLAHACYLAYNPTTITAGAYRNMCHGSIRMYEALGGGKWGTYNGGDVPSGTALSTGTRYILGCNGGNYRKSATADGTYSTFFGGAGKIGGESTSSRNVSGDMDQVIAYTAAVGGTDRDNLETYMTAGDLANVAGGLLWYDRYAAAVLNV